MLGLLIVGIVAALAFAAINYYGVRRLDAGTEAMVDIAGAIREGADAFMLNEYRIIFPIVIFIAVILALLVSWYTGVSFILGAFMSATAGWIGMKIATIANVRVSNEARKSENIGRTLKIAFRGGSVMGLCVGGFSLLGLLIIYVVFGRLLGQTDPSQMKLVKNFIDISFIPFTMTVSGYALGCSVIAMFDRVGGGIYTKAADMGADLVGKTEANIPEDDARNPATIADNVGDNVGDVAGLGADLLESYVGAIISSVVLTAAIFFTTNAQNGYFSPHFMKQLIEFPLMFAAVGILSSIVGIALLLMKKAGNNPHRELNMTVFVAAFLTIAGTAALTFVQFGAVAPAQFVLIGFKLGWISPWLAALLGIVAGIAIGQLAEYYTSYHYKPTQRISAASREGVALNITEGMAVGMKSTFFPLIVLALTVIGSYAIASLYGVAMAAIGMLSFVVSTVSVDTYGPIADNAGGIAEMAKLSPRVREITDELDSVGNTTAAIGKGFAIGSASLAALSLFASFLYSQVNNDTVASFEGLLLNMINPLVLAGALIGAALPYFFSGILIEAVTKAARKMVQEVRRQFREHPLILTGEERPDYRECISISSAGALAEMKVPAFMAVFTPIITGFLFGAQFVGGLLIGTTLSAILLALYSANSGGAWDNAKKYVEQGRHGGKGSDAHAAAVVGDTVGDPLKDTVGPSLDILIKIMAVVSLITVSIFQRYNLIGLFSG